MSKYHSVLYHTPNCYKCKLTMQELQKVMRVKVEHLFDGNDDWSDRKIQKFREQGYASFPVVRIYETESGRRMDDWCDFQVAKINHWVQKAKEEQ